jgi:hypothetical protein
MGSLNHLAAEPLKKVIGIDVSNPTSILRHVKTGKLKALGIMGYTFIGTMRNVPRAVETGDEDRQHGRMVWPACAGGHSEPIVQFLERRAGANYSTCLTVSVESIRALGITPSPRTPERARPTDPRESFGAG